MISNLGALHHLDRDSVMGSLNRSYLIKSNKPIIINNQNHFNRKDYELRINNKNKNLIQNSSKKNKINQLVDKFSQTFINENKNIHISTIISNKKNVVKR